MTFSVISKTLENTCLAKKRRRDTQQNDTQHNDTKNNKNYTQHYNDTSAECQYAEHRLSSNYVH